MARDTTDKRRQTGAAQDRKRPDALNEHAARPEVAQAEAAEHQGRTGGKGKLFPRIRLGRDRVKDQQKQLRCNMMEASLSTLCVQRRSNMLAVGNLSQQWLQAQNAEDDERLEELTRAASEAEAQEDELSRQWQIKVGEYLKAECGLEPACDLNTGQVTFP